MTDNWYQQSPERKPLEDESKDDSGSLLDEILYLTRATSQPSRVQDLVSELVNAVSQCSNWFDGSLLRTLDNAITSIDTRISEQLTEILHHRDVQELEGTWFGLRKTVDACKRSESVKIRILDITPRELMNDAREPISEVADRVFERELGTPGGEPFSVLVTDLGFTNHPEDLELLGRMGELAERACAPFIASARPELLGLGSFEMMDVTPTAVEPDYSALRQFRQTSRSRFVALTMPRVLARLPYGKDSAPVAEFSYEECPLDTHGNQLPLAHDDYCWMASSFEFAARLAQSAAEIEPTAAVLGLGDRLEFSTPRFHRATIEGESLQRNVKGPTEVSIPDATLMSLERLGLMVVSQDARSGNASFYSSTNLFDNSTREAADESYSQLAVIMTGSRVFHQFVQDVRLKRFRSQEDFIAWSGEWFEQFITTDPDFAWRIHGRRPLRSAKIGTDQDSLTENFIAKVRLVPWVLAGTKSESIDFRYEIPRSSHWVNSRSLTTGPRACVRLHVANNRNLLTIGSTYLLEAFVSGDLSHDTIDRERSLTVENVQYHEFTIVMRCEAIDISPQRVRSFYWQDTGPVSPTQFFIRPLRIGKQKISVDFLYRNHWLTTATLEVDVV